VEVGTTGSAVAGSVTIDSDVTTTMTGSSYIAANPSIVDNGTIIVAAGGTLQLFGSLSGNGQIELDSGADLMVFQPAAATAPSISFEGTGDTLTLYSSSFNASQQFTPHLIDFDSSDVIDYQGTVTSAVYASTGTDIGTLSLYNDANLVGTLTLVGDYTGHTFYTVSVSGGTQIGDPPAPALTVADGATSEIRLCVRRCGDVCRQRRHATA
jgi:hypothetical protein